jgi:hypothetical protein
MKKILLKSGKTFESFVFIGSTVYVNFKDKNNRPKCQKIDDNYIFSVREINAMTKYLAETFKLMNALKNII